MWKPCSALFWRSLIADVALQAQRVAAAAAAIAEAAADGYDGAGVEAHSHTLLKALRDAADLDRRLTSIPGLSPILACSHPETAAFLLRALTAAAQPSAGIPERELAEALLPILDGQAAPPASRPAAAGSLPEARLAAWRETLTTLSELLPEILNAHALHRATRQTAHEWLDVALNVDRPTH